MNNELKKEEAGQTQAQTTWVLKRTAMTSCLFEYQNALLWKHPLNCGKVTILLWPWPVVIKHSIPSTFGHVTFSRASRARCTWNPLAQTLHYAKKEKFSRIRNYQIWEVRVNTLSFPLSSHFRSLPLGTLIKKKGSPWARSVTDRNPNRSNSRWYNRDHGEIQG